MKDPVMIDLERYLTESEEGYIDPAQLRRDRDEWLADQSDYIEEEDYPTYKIKDVNC
jgi:hypothetical protein